MNFKLKFESNDRKIPMNFGAVQNASDGGYERGYADGVASVPDYLAQLLNGTIAEYESDAVTKVKLHSFRNAKDLRKISLHNCIETEASAFQNCDALKDIYMPKLEILGNTTFGWCGMERLVLYSIRQIAARAFYYSTKFAKLIIMPKDGVVPLENTDAFNGTPIKSGAGYIYVPDGLVDAYKSAANWSTLAAQIRPLSDLKEG